MSKFIVALRTDGLGVRLMALLNAKRLANYLKCEFKFGWDDNKSNNPFHDVESKEKTFTKKYLAKHWVSKDHLDGRRSLSLEDFSESADEGVYFQCPQSVSGDLRAVKEVYDAMTQKPYASEFESIGFSEEAKIAISLAREVDIPPESVALHLRAGRV